MELTARRRVTADRYKPNTWRPHGTYVFSEATRPMWEEVWRWADGDLVKLVKFAETNGKPDPHEWVAQLHRFLFYTFPGVAWLSRYPQDGFPREAGRARPESFIAYCRQIADDHAEDPYERGWYKDRGVSADEFVRVLRLQNAEDDVPEEALVSHINSRIPDLGFRLREAYDLLTVPDSTAKITEVRQSLQRVAAGIRAEMAR